MTSFEREQILTEVPSSLKRLARLVVRGFYGIEHAIVMDMLVSNQCMKEDDMSELLKFDRKHLRAIMSTLKADKFVKVRLRVETQPDGKTSKHNYYHINYKVFVNVIKYKLDHMRRKIETEERDSTSRSSFKCPNCQKTFTDLEVDQLLDFATGELRCTYCSTNVEEDQSCLPKKDARTLLARFNEQMQPIFDLLREAEDMRLAQSILEPEPVTIESIKANMPKGSQNVAHKRDANQHVWSGETKGGGMQMYEQDVTINVGESVKETPVAKELKEQPVWLTESTVQGVLPEYSSFPTADIIPGPSAVSADVAPEQHNDIMSALLAHEKKHGTPMNIPRQGSDNESSTSEEDSQQVQNIQTIQNDAIEMESEDEDDLHLVSIGSLRIPLDDVTEKHVAMMTQGEKDAYIRLGQEIHASLHD